MTNRTNRSHIQLKKCDDQDKGIPSKKVLVRCNTDRVPMYTLVSSDNLTVSNPGELISELRANFKNLISITDFPEPVPFNIIEGKLDEASNILRLIANAVSGTVSLKDRLDVNHTEKKMQLEFLRDDCFGIISATDAVIDMITNARDQVQYMLAYLDRCKDGTIELE